MPEHRLPPPAPGPHRAETSPPLSLMVLIGIEVFAVALSGAWALAGLLELGDYLAYALMGIFALVAAWLMLNLWRKAASVDPTR